MKKCLEISHVLVKPYVFQSEVIGSLAFPAVFRGRYLTLLSQRIFILCKSATCLFRHYNDRTYSPVSRSFVLLFARDIF